MRYSESKEIKVIPIINERFRSKFEPKNKQMILVGYEPKRKIYILWLPDTNQVEISRDGVIIEPISK